MSDVIQRTDLLALARSHADAAGPGEQLEIVLARNESTSAQVYGGEVESFTLAETFGVGVRVILDHRQGFAHAGSFEPDVIAETVAAARDNVRFGEPDPFFGLAEPDGVVPIDQELWNDAVPRASVETKIGLALALEAAVRAGDPRISGVRNASYGDSAGEIALVTNTGIAIASRATSCHLSVSALASDGDETQTGWSVDVGRDPEALDVDKVAADAVEQATRLLGARQPASQRVKLLLEPKLAATLLAIVGGMLTGDRVLKGRTPFADRLGDQIASPLFSLVDDPTNPASLGADTHDGEGLACRRTPLVVSGVLGGFLHNSYTARRAGTVSTGSAVRGSRSLPGVGAQALAVEPGTRSASALLAEIDQGVLVQSMAGLHSGVNPISGDFSVGADGLMIRGGELAEPIREATIASTLQRMLLDIEAVGAELEWLPSGTGAPALVIGDVALSGS